MKTLDMGKGGKHLFDFERPAINTAQFAFPEGAAKGCLFHYLQAVQRNVYNKRLATVYQQAPQGPYNAPQYDAVRTWIRRHIGLALLPQHLVYQAWNRILATPPVTNDPAIDADMINFRQYYEREWLPNAAKIDLFNHWDNPGPRTTNHAEGHNNGLRAKFDNPHPRLAVFLVRLQDMHHVSDIRCQQLLNGAQPTQRDQRWIQNDMNIQNAKQKFENIIAAMNNQDPHYDQHLDTEISRYLDHVQHYIG